MAAFNKTIIPLALVGYEMIIANSALPGIIVNYKVKTIAGFESPGIVSRGDPLLTMVQANDMLFS